MTRHCAKLGSWLVLATTCGIAAAQLPPGGPRAPKRAHRIELHGQVRVDEYFWLRDKNDPATRAFLEAENAYAAALTQPTAKLTDQLYAEMLGRIQQSDVTVPARRGEYFYYSRTFEGKQYPVYCRKKGSVDAAEEVILDLNALAVGQKYLGLGAFAVSDDGKLLAYAVDTTGFREFEFQLKDLTTGRLLDDRLGKVTDVEWSADGAHLWYVVEDAAKRDYRVHRHRLGQSKTEDALVFEEKDEIFTVGISRTLDRKYLVLTSESFESIDARVVDCARPTAEPQVIRPREARHRYRVVGHRGDDFYLLSNKGAKNFRLVKARATATDRDWIEVTPHRANVLLDNALVFADHIVLDEKENGLDRLAVLSGAANQRREIVMPEPSYQLARAENFEFAAREFRFGYSSLVTPRSIYDYDMTTGERRLLKRQPVLGGYDQNKFAVERVWVMARDGVRVPMSIVRKAGQPRDGAAPCLLYAYGAYGFAHPAEFDSELVSLLDRGFVYALAHVRGGNDLGEPWHDDGKMLRKKNTFYDFIDCGNWLCDNGYTSHQRLGIHGVSAGGLLIGAALNLAPPAFCKAAVLQVPFVDVINTMLDETIPLTTQEFFEWGNPKKPDQFAYMNSYCPYTNLAPRPYPSMLVLTSFNDSQVLYHEPAKYVAKLRTLKTDSNPLVFRCNMAAGHGGSSGRYDNLKETAFIYSFLIAQLR